MTSPAPEPVAAPGDRASRADWLAVLAGADAGDLARVAGPVLADYRFEPLRAPETGLVMVRARIGNTGDRFHVGEATVTRCAVRWQPANAAATAGVGYVLGRDAERALCVAQVDALLQHPPLHEALVSGVVEPLRAATAARHRAQREAAETSRVRFFTVQPEAA